MPRLNVPLPAAAVGKLLLTPKEAAAALAISERKLWQLMKDGTIPCIRIGRATRYAVGDLQEFVEKRKEVIVNECP